VVDLPLATNPSIATLPLPDPLQGTPKTEKIDPEQSRLHDEFGIEVPFVRIGAPQKRYFRISAQLYNSLVDYEKLAQGIQKLLPTG